VGSFQAFIYDITQHLYFKRAIAVLVLFNSFLLSVKWEEDIDNDDDDDLRSSNVKKQSKRKSISDLKLG
jgi:hypothetical protein